MMNHHPPCLSLGWYPLWALPGHLLSDCSGKSHYHQSTSTTQCLSVWKTCRVHWHLSALKAPCVSVVTASLLVAIGGISQRCFQKVTFEIPSILRRGKPGILRHWPLSLCTIRDYPLADFWAFDNWVDIGKRITWSLKTEVQVCSVPHGHVPQHKSLPFLGISFLPVESDAPWTIMCNTKLRWWHYGFFKH